MHFLIESKDNFSAIYMSRIMDNFQTIRIYLITKREIALIFLNRDDTNAFAYNVQLMICPFGDATSHAG